MTSADKYPSAAKSELRSMLFWPTSLCVIGALALAVHGVMHYGVWQGWASIATAIGLGVFAWGLYTLRAWARWVVVAITGVMVVGRVYVLARDGIASWIQGVESLFGLLFWGGILMYFASPWTGRVFRTARSQWEPRSAKAREAASAEAAPGAD